MTLKATAIICSAIVLLVFIGVVSHTAYEVAVVVTDHFSLTRDKMFLFLQSIDMTYPHIVEMFKRLPSYCWQVYKDLVTSLTDIILQWVGGFFSCPKPQSFLFGYLVNYGDGACYYYNVWFDVEPEEMRVSYLVLASLTVAALSQIVIILFWLRSLWSWWTGVPDEWRIRELFSRYLDWRAERPQVVPSHCRSSFNGQLIPHVKAADNHSHGESACNRSTGTQFIRTFSLTMGWEPYFYQCSASDQKRGDAGSRNYFWAKDTQVVPKALNLQDNHLLAMVMIMS
jgi:hypothetical protein